MLEGNVQTTWSRGPKVVVDCSSDKIRTKQSFRNEADINQIVARYKRTGMLMDPGVVARREAIFGDFSLVGDFHQAQDKLVKGREAFDSLSSSVRARFQNSPGNLLDFMADESNREEAVRLGIVPKPEPRAEPAVMEPVAPVAPVAPVVQKEYAVPGSKDADR